MTYKRIIDKEGNIWYVPTDGDNNKIYVSNSNKTGFGGRSLTFNLEDGTQDTAQGPWNSNPDSLFECTGIDLRGNK